MDNAYQVLQERGFFYQLTDEQQAKKMLAPEKSLTFYVGFDPTADSLHIGHLLPIMAMRWLQRCGHKPIALVGGGTAMVGDPSGKTSSRPILTKKQISKNADALKEQMSRFLDFSEDQAILLNNAQWLENINYIDFLRDVGKHFSINRMLAAESVKQRLEHGLSFLEFNYMLLQAYDFYILHKDYQCTMQFGGQDQWGNIVAGVDLTRRMLRKEVFGATFPLLLKSDGEKFGKSEGGAIWLDTKRTSTFQYYQFWRNVEDSEVTKLLSFFTYLPMDEVKRLGSLQPPQINRAKEILAFEATMLAHGYDEACKAYLTAGNEFGFADPKNEISTSSKIAQVKLGDANATLPTYELPKQEVTAGIRAVQLFVKAEMINSIGNARRMVRQGGCYLNDQRIADENYQIKPVDVKDNIILLRAGKKKRMRILIK